MSITFLCNRLIGIRFHSQLAPKTYNPFILVLFNAMILLTISASIVVTTYPTRVLQFIRHMIKDYEIQFCIIFYSDSIFGDRVDSILIVKLATIQQNN